jgi:hypothetical protein
VKDGVSNQQRKVRQMRATMILRSDSSHSDKRVALRGQQLMPIAEGAAPSRFR